MAMKLILSTSGNKRFLATLSSFEPVTLEAILILKIMADMSSVNNEYVLLAFGEENKGLFAKELRRLANSLISSFVNELPSLNSESNVPSLNLAYKSQRLSIFSEVHVEVVALIKSKPTT